MSCKTKTKSFIPQLDGRSLDFIKIIAVLAMLVDHMDFVWFNRSVFEMTLIGRLAFPLFCYGVSISVKRAADQSIHKYFMQIIVLAVLVDPLVQLTRGANGDANVLFTLAFGALFAYWAQGLKDWQVMGAYVIAILLIPFATTMEYGTVGMVLPSAFLMCMDRGKRYLPFLCVLLFGCNQVNAMWEYGADFSILEVLPSAILMAGMTIFGTFFILKLSEDSIPQDKRWLSRYSLHVFYPGHLLLLFVLGLIFFKKEMVAAGMLWP